MVCSIQPQRCTAILRFSRDVVHRGVGSSVDQVFSENLWVLLQQVSLDTDQSADPCWTADEWCLVWTNQFSLGLTRPDQRILLFTVLSSFFQVFCTNETLLLCHSVIKSRSVESSSSGCSSAAQFHLHTGSLKSSQRCYQVLGHFLDFLIMEATVRQGDFSAAELFSLQPVSEHRRQFL